MSWADHQAGPLLFQARLPPWRLGGSLPGVLARTAPQWPSSEPKDRGAGVDSWSTRPHSSQGHRLPLGGGHPPSGPFRKRADFWPETAGPTKMVLVTSASCPEGETSPPTHPPAQGYPLSASGSWWPHPGHTPVPDLGCPSGLPELGALATQPRCKFGTLRSYHRDLGGARAVAPRGPRGETPSGPSRLGLCAYSPAAMGRNSRTTNSSLSCGGRKLKGR